MSDEMINVIVGVEVNPTRLNIKNYELDISILSNFVSLEYFI